jgi:hypothetical protein
MLQADFFTAGILGNQSLSQAALGFLNELRESNRRYNQKLGAEMHGNGTFRVNFQRENLRRWCRRCVPIFHKTKGSVSI